MFIRFDLSARRISRLTLPDLPAVTAPSSFAAHGAGSASIGVGGPGALGTSMLASGSATVSMRAAAVGTIRTSFSALGSSYVALKNPTLESKASNWTASGSGLAAFAARAQTTVATSWAAVGVGQSLFLDSGRDPLWNSVGLYLPAEVSDGTLPVDVSSNRFGLTFLRNATGGRPTVENVNGPDVESKNPLTPGQRRRGSRGAMQVFDGIGGAGIVVVGAGTVPAPIHLAGKDFCIEYWYRRPRYTNTLEPAVGVSLHIGPPDVDYPADSWADAGAAFKIAHSSREVSAYFQSKTPGAQLPTYYATAQGDATWALGQEWAHIRVARRGEYMRLYVNGYGGRRTESASVLDALMTRDGSWYIGGMPITVGGTGQTFPSWFSGEMAHFRVTVGDSRVDPEVVDFFQLPDVPFPRY